MKVYLEPSFGDRPDPGHGGVRRVVEGLRAHLGEYDIELAPTPQEADLVHCHVTPMSETERYLKRNTHVPYILSSHGYYWLEYEWEDWALKANRECLKAAKAADHVIAPSEWVAKTIRRNTLRPTTPLPHGIEQSDWPRNLPKENYVLWNKTRVDPVCDPGPINTLAEQMPDVKFVSTFGRKGLPNLELTGRVPYEEAHRYVERAGIYLCTPRETFGIGTLEAMAAGVPIVGWNWGGQREIIEHEQTGWLSTPGDFEDLMKGIRYCFEHQEEMGARAREIALGMYQWKDVVGKYADLYRKIFQEKSSDGPRVSIIVPAHKLEEFLPEALDSVINQTSEDWECVVVDDASPDSCGEIAESYAARDSRFSVIHNETNQYLAGALNTGITAARGRYILPLDADNQLPQKAVELLAAALDDNRDLHIAYGSVEFLDPPSKEYPNGKQWHSGWPPEFRTEWQILRDESKDRPNNLIPSGSMYRKPVWAQTGGYRRRWKTAEDADFWTRATSYGFAAERVTSADVLVYRNRTGSMSRDEPTPDWSTWYPWSRERATPPAAINFEEQPPVPSYEPILISVIIPVGPGHTQLVVDAIDSVDAQTFRLWECIVINNSGEDLPNLPNWAEVITTEKEIGVAAARNIGIKHSQGTFFVPLDADDTLEPEALAKMHSVWTIHKRYVYSDWYERWKDRPPKIWECHDYDAWELTKKGCLHTVTALYPKSAWETIGGFDEDLVAWEDWDFQLALAKIGVCGIRIPEPLLAYRKDTGMRREENYSEFESSKQGIVRKWGPYFTGREELMGCKGCSKKTIAKAQTTPAQPAGAAAANDGEMVLIEYVGAKEGVLNYKGPSGQMYRFGAVVGENQKFVLSKDAEYFINMRDFRLLEKEAPVGTGS